MADADILITAGSGTKIDTRTVGAGTDEHRQVMVVGDPSTATAVASVTAANGLAVDVTRVTGVVDTEGSVAHDGIDSGFPVKMGSRARSAVITSVASDDRADTIGTLQGYPVYFPFALPQSALTGTASSTAATDTAVIAAQAAGVTICVTSIAVYNDSTTNTYVNIKDGATTRLVLPAPAKGGAMHTLPFPLRLTAATALNFASASAVTTMFVSAVGFASI